MKLLLSNLNKRQISPTKESSNLIKKVHSEVAMKI
jgi:hypothetical protein